MGHELRQEKERKKRVTKIGKQGVTLCKYIIKRGFVTRTDIFNQPDEVVLRSLLSSGFADSGRGIERKKIYQRKSGLNETLPLGWLVSRFTNEGFRLLHQESSWWCKFKEQVSGKLAMAGIPAQDRHQESLHADQCT